MGNPFDDKVYLNYADKVWYPGEFSLVTDRDGVVAIDALLALTDVLLKRVLLPFSKIKTFPLGAGSGTFFIPPTKFAEVYPERLSLVLHGVPAEWRSKFEPEGR